MRKDRKNLSLGLRFGLRQANGALLVIPLATLLQKIDTLEAFKDTALGADG